MPLLAIILALAFAPVQRPVDVVKWSVTVPDASTAPGGELKIKVTASVQPGWKLYAIDQPPAGPQPLAFEITGKAPFEIVRKGIVPPKAKVQKNDENFSADTRYYENEAAFTVPVSIPSGTAAGPHTVPLEVTFQACGQDLCLRPFTQKLPTAITVRR